MNKSIFLSLAIAVLLPISAHSQTPITSVPMTISTSGDYVVANELYYTSAGGTAITVAVPNVTIDFNGYFLFCTVASPVNNGVLVNNGCGNVTIKNGSVVGFYHCIYFNAASNTSLSVAEVVENMRVANAHDGIYFVTPSGCRIQDNYIANCTANGVWVGTASPDNGNTIQDNQAINCGSGYNTFGGSFGNYLFNNFASHCAIGLNMDGGDRYRFNVTNACTTPFSLGTALTDGNN
jgi:hypothetical protein